jgi:hypothetical protein
MNQPTPFRPLVTAATTAQSIPVSSITTGIKNGKYRIPSYQRDSEEWSNEKRSLFIESVINNLTIPPLIVYPEDDPEIGVEVRYVIDGQQRITTLRQFVNNEFSLASDEEVEYADNVGPRIQGCKFEQLDESIRDQIQDYVLNLIVLPKNLELSMRLLIFRRINEEGVPLSAHDLRLASFGDCNRVSLVRLAGVRDPSSSGGARMIAAAKSYEIDFPWSDVNPWSSWWGDSRQSTGQFPSEMFLFYLVGRMLSPNRQTDVFAALLSKQAQSQLRLRYDKTTTSVLDLICAQMLHEDTSRTAAQFLPTLEVLLNWFRDFELWFNNIVTSKIPGSAIPINAARKLAFYIAAASETWESPDALSDSQWQLTTTFLRKGPADIESTIGVKYPITKGKWPGQKTQIEATWEVVKQISLNG